MEPKKPNDEKSIKLRILLKTADVTILNRLRGDLSPSDFFASVLRMLGSGAVTSTPEWANRPIEKPKE